jgi:predicted outer membrane repeat protein
VNIGYTDGSGHGMVFTGCSNIEIKNCVFDVNSINAVAMAGSGSKFYFHDNITRNTGRIHVSTGNNAYDDIQFYNNRFEGTGTYDPKTLHTDGLMIGADGVDTYKITNLKIYNNKWYGDWRRGATALIYLNGSPNHYGCDGVQIFNNLMVFENNTSLTGGAIFSPSTIFIALGHRNVKIYNNTIDARAYTSSVVGICISSGNYSSSVMVNNVDIRNNILAGCDNGVLIDKGSTGWTIDSNIYHTVGGNHLIWDANGRYNTCADAQAAGWSTTFCSVADPKIVALPSGGITGSGDWKLGSDSPALNAGANLSGYFLTDIRGQLRPTGAWTLGAYEGSSGLGLAAPKNLRIGVQ